MNAHRPRRDAKIPRHWLPLGAILAGVVFLVSCASPPAKLKEIRMADAAGREMEGLGLHDLASMACEQESAETSCDYLADFVAAWKRARPADDEGVIRREEGSSAPGGEPIRVRFIAVSRGAFLPSYFDRLDPAKEFRVKGLAEYRREGIGAPLLAVRENRHAEPIERFFPPEAISRALTAVVRETGRRNGERYLEIELLNTLQQDEIVKGGKTIPIAANTTVSWAGLLHRARRLDRSRIWDTLRRNPKRDPQLYLMEPYDREKEPLILIHGLFDTPLAWAGLTNELWADEEIRHRYQVWHFHYNTSAPALYAGRILRERLRELRPMLDPEGDDPAMRSTTVIGRSMGGIVARSLVTDPGDAFWDAAFTRPLDQLVLLDEDREKLIEAFLWKPDRTVRRVIFVATPHRGSDFADNPLGKFGRTIVAPPNGFRAFYERVSKANPGAFTEDYRRLGKGKLDSVHALSPEQPTLRILADLPMIEGLKVHSIIGDRGKPGPLEESGDGLVPYWSSHLDEADSELVVPFGHRVHEHPDAIAEIVRLLWE